MTARHELRWGGFAGLAFIVPFIALVAGGVFVLVASGGHELSPEGSSGSPQPHPGEPWPGC